MNIIKCAYVDENGLQCRATTGTPYADGWGNLSVFEARYRRKGGMVLPPIITERQGRS